MKGEKDIKVKQFAIAVKKNTLKRGSNLKTESLQERDDEKLYARGKPQRYAMSQISNRSKKASVRGIQAAAFLGQRVKPLKDHNSIPIYRKPSSVPHENAKPVSENTHRHNITLVKKDTQQKKRENGKRQHLGIDQKEEKVTQSQLLLRAQVYF